MTTDLIIKQEMFEQVLKRNLEEILDKDEIEGRLTVRNKEDFIFSFTCGGGILNIECIKPVPEGSNKIRMQTLVNKLNEETGLEKYFLSEIDGKRLFNMSLIYPFLTPTPKDIEDGIKYVIEYAKQQALEGYNTLL